jgi:transcription initiation factor TFIIIB Brf1 subunit/transcription initiation factor TFIIB
MTANTTTPEIKGVEVKAENITFTDTTIPEGKGSDVVAWAKAAGKTPAEVAAAATLFNNYLLNVADLTVNPQIKIVSIDVTKSPVEVVAEVTDANGSTFKKTLDADDIEGALKYKAAATLEDLKKATPKTDIATGDQFIQVVVE